MAQWFPQHWYIKNVMILKDLYCLMDMDRMAIIHNLALESP